MGVAAAAIFVILVCLCSTSKANLLSKNKEPQQTPATQVSPACRQRDQRCNLAQQILSAWAPGKAQPPWCAAERRHRLPCVGLSPVHCWLSRGNGTTAGFFRTNSPAEQAALICTRAPEEWHDPHSISSWSCMVTDTFTCAQKEGCGRCPWVAGRRYS